MKYPAYPAYRPVHSPALKQLPAHWAVNRVKFIATVGNGSTPSRDESAYWQEGTFPWLNSSVVNQEVVTHADQFVTAIALRECHLPRVVPPAVLVGITGEGRTRGMATTLAIEATINQHLAYVKPAGDEVDVRFLRRVFDASYDHLRSESEGAGSTKGAITCEQIKEMALPVPPSGEQRAIAAFLDWRTAQIDALIAKKQSLLERLTEKRVNVIASSVTNGLVRQIETRPSGAAWFAQVPKHWHVKRIKFIGTVGNGSTPARDDSSYWNEGNFPWLNSSVANQEAVTEAEQFVTPLALKECHLPIIEPPAVLVGITGQGKTRGMATTLMIRATINQHLAYIKPVETECEVRFLRRVFDAAYAYLRNESDGGGSTKGAITCEQIAELPIPLPPLKEQQAIADHIDKVLDRINRIADKATTAIERLTEYRSALITAAVTGQIDVRGVQVPAPG